MNAREIEYWARNVIDRVKGGQQCEDVRVELKAELPLDHQKAARRIAGQANAARGEPILYLAGVDEKKGVTGVANTNLADWWNQVKSNFESFVPPMREHAFGVDSLTVLAMQFDTDGGPFVVRTGAGAVTLEVPWRDGTGIRSAGRAELLKLLIPQASLPHVEQITARAQCQPQAADFFPKFGEWTIDVRVYMTPRTPGTLVLPRHRAGVFKDGGANGEFAIPDFQFGVVSGGFSSVTNVEAMLEGPAMVEFHAKGSAPVLEREVLGPLQLQIRLGLAGEDARLVFSLTLPFVTCNGFYRWGDWFRAW